jgi:hypothetical protein
MPKRQEERLTLRAGEPRNDPDRAHSTASGRSPTLEIRLFSAVFGAIDLPSSISGENGLASDFELLL